VKNLLLTLVITLMLAGSLCAGTVPIAAVNATQAVFMDINSFLLPLCAPGDLCDNNRFALAPGDGAPMPVCQPGKNCNNDQLQLRAGDGAPMPVCQPGKNCNNDQLQLRAGDGAPMPVCQPGKNCNNDQLQLRAGDGRDMFWRSASRIAGRPSATLSPC
jgi:hypothetical protein